MLSTHSIPEQLLVEIKEGVFANYRKCKYLRKNIPPPEPLRIRDEAMLDSNEPCLVKVGNILYESGLTNGYSPTIAEVQAIIGMDILYLKIAKANTTDKSTTTVFMDLADLAGYHVEIYGAEDALKQETLDYFNERGFGEYYQCTRNDFIELYNFFRFVSMVLLHDTP